MKKKTGIILVSYLAAAIVVLGAAAGVFYNRSVRYGRYLTNNYQHAFGELVTSVSEMDTALRKSLYATSPAMASSTCTQVFGKAMTAQMSLGVLPFSTEELEQTASFISKVGDYAYSLARKTASGSGYSQEELDNLTALADTAEILAMNLKQLQTDMSDGHLTMDELEASQDRMDELEENMEPSTLSQSMRLIEQEFPEIPSLVYDGPFSEHIITTEPVLLEGKEEISENEARKIAASFLGMQEGRVYPAGETDGKIPCYYLAADGEDINYTVAVSRKGGAVIGMLSDAAPERSGISIQEAALNAARFLERRGYKNMSESYHMQQGNITTVNFAYKQGDVVCYSDLIKVAVAMDTGKIVGFEASGYVNSHAQRRIDEPAVDSQTARAYLPEGIEVESERLALVPSDGKYEVLCHEFVCTAAQDRKMIVYVDAQTGQQHKILILLEDDNGTLTI